MRSSRRAFTLIELLVDRHYRGTHWTAPSRGSKGPRGSGEQSMQKQSQANGDSAAIVSRWKSELSARVSVHGDQRRSQFHSGARMGLGDVYSSVHRARQPLQPASGWHSGEFVDSRCQCGGSDTNINLHLPLPFRLAAAFGLFRRPEHSRWLKLSSCLQPGIAGDCSGGSQQLCGLRRSRRRFGRGWSNREWSLLLQQPDPLDGYKGWG